MASSNCYCLHDISELFLSCYAQVARNLFSFVCKFLEERLTPPHLLLGILGNGFVKGNFALRIHKVYSDEISPQSSTYTTRLSAAQQPRSLGITLWNDARVFMNAKLTLLLVVCLLTILGCVYSKFWFGWQSTFNLQKWQDCQLSAIKAESAGDLPNAEQKYLLAASTARENSGESSAQTIFSLTELGDYYSRINRLDKAINYYQQALSRCPKSPAGTAEGKRFSVRLSAPIYSGFARAFKLEHQLSEAARICKQALNTLEHTTTDDIAALQEQADLLAVLGQIYEQSGDRRSTALLEGKATQINTAFSRALPAATILSSSVAEQSELRDTVNNARRLLAHGSRQQAVQHLARALKLVSNSRLDNVDLQTLSLLSCACQELGDIPNAKKYALRALKLSNAGRINQPDMVEYINRAASVYLSAHEWSRSRQLSEKAEQILDSLPDAARYPAFYYTYLNACNALIAMNKQAEAQAILQKALKIVEGSSTANPSLEFGLFAKLIPMYLFAGQAAQAEHLSRTALKLSRSAFGEASEQTDTVTVWLARAALLQGRRNEMDSLGDKLDSIRRRTRDKNDNLANLLYTLADVRIQQKNFVAAEQALEELLSLPISARQGQATQVARSSLANLSFLKGDLKKAAALFSLALAEPTDKNDSCIVRINLRNQYAYTLWLDKQWNKAQQQYGLALSSASSCCGKHSLPAAFAMEGLGRACLRNHDVAQAKSYFTEDWTIIGHDARTAGTGALCAALADGEISVARQSGHNDLVPFLRELTGRCPGNVSKQ